MRVLQQPSRTPATTAIKLTGRLPEKMTGWTRQAKLRNKPIEIGVLRPEIGDASAESRAPRQNNAGYPRITRCNNSLRYSLVPGAVVLPLWPREAHYRKGSRIHQAPAVAHELLAKGPARFDVPFDLSFEGLPSHCSQGEEQAQSARGARPRRGCRIEIMTSFGCRRHVAGAACAGPGRSSERRLPRSVARPLCATVRGCFSLAMCGREPR